MPLPKGTDKLLFSFSLLSPGEPIDRRVGDSPQRGVSRTSYFKKKKKEEKSFFFQCFNF